MMCRVFLEIPVVIARKYKKNMMAFIALGCVIKGETPHFDFISKATTDAIMKLSIEKQKTYRKTE